MKSYYVIFFLFVLVACDSKKTDTKPKAILDEVLLCRNQEGLLKKYGKEHVRLDTSWVMGDDTLTGSILFPNSDRQAFVYFHEGKIVDVSVKGETSKWKTSSGLYLGMTLQEVQKINQKNFTISGFHWAHGGFVVSWEGGKLAGNSSLSHLVTFSNVRNLHQGISDEVYKQICGEAEFDVRHPAIQRLNPTLDLISIIEPFIPTQKEGLKMGQKIQKSQIPSFKIN